MEAVMMRIAMAIGAETIRRPQTRRPPRTSTGRRRRRIEALMAKEKAAARRIGVTRRNLRMDIGNIPGSSCTARRRVFVRLRHRLKNSRRFSRRRDSTQPDGLG
jgi:hypothetical protein